MTKLSPHPMMIFERISVQEKINFARHLALVIKAGLPVLAGLQIVRKQTVSKLLLRVIDQLIIDINNGLFLADSLKHFHRTFGDFFISIVGVGETSGTLVENLLYLADEMEKAKDLQSAIRSALLYPLVILIATTGIVGLLVFSIFPKVLPIFSSLKVQLPLSTRILIGLSSFLLAHGLAFLVASVVAVILFLLLFQRVTGIRFFFHRASLYVPILSTLVVDVNIASLTRVLNVLLKSGIKIVEALGVTSQTLDNLVYRAALLEASEGVRRGEQISDYLDRHRKIFPPIASGLIAIGESTGNLEQNLAYLSEYYAKESATMLKSLTAILEPLLLLVMGSLVGFVALSIITPIYQLTSAIH